tara:strand:+ start:86 stop:346 length:261 start_codon:yes stop_codon:yes gene_type:complete
MLKDLIYFRRMIVAYKNGIINKIDINGYIAKTDAIKHYDINDKELLKNIDIKINSLCNHEVIDDFIENAQGEMYKIHYCKHCELTM